MAMQYRLLRVSRGPARVILLGLLGAVLALGWLGLMRPHAVPGIAVLQAEEGSRDGQDATPSLLPNQSVRSLLPVPAGVLTGDPQSPSLDPLVQADACLGRETGFEERALCLASLDLSGVAPQELAAWLCSTSWGAEEQGLVASAMLVGRSAPEFLEYIDIAQSSCERIAVTSVWENVMRWAGRQDPGWAEEVHRHLTPERLFGDHGEALVLLAGFFIDEGDDYLLAVLEEGGRGSLGGRAEVMDRAAWMAALRQGPGTRRLSYVESLIGSPNTTGEGYVGCTLVGLLASANALVDRSSAQAQALLNSALDDPRFAEDAANQLFAQFPDGPPPGFDDDPEGWERLMQRAAWLRSNQR